MCWQLKQGSESVPYVLAPFDFFSGSETCVPKLEKVVYGQVKQFHACPGGLFLKSCHQKTEGCTKQHVAHQGRKQTPCKCIHTYLYVEHICETLTFSCLCKVLAVLLLHFLFCCWLCELAAVWPGCSFAVCALGAKYWSQDYNLAFIVSSRFSQHHKYNARVLNFLLNIALMRLVGHAFCFHICSLYNLNRGIFKTRYCICTDLVSII